jgi:hypothetical protein
LRVRLPPSAVLPKCEFTYYYGRAPMETQTESNTPLEILAGKLCIAASISILLGIGLFFLVEVHSGDGSCSFLILLVS